MTTDLSELENKLIELLRSGHLSGYRAGVPGSGPYVAALEAELSRRFDDSPVICCNSATSGLIVAIKAAMRMGAIPTRPRIAVPDCTMTATGAAVYHAAGVLPVLIECDSRLLGRYDLINESHAIDLVIAVPLFGNFPPDVFKPLLERSDLAVIFDDAQFGPFPHSEMTDRWEDKPAQQNFIARVLSFNQHKHVSAGEGGAVVVNKQPPPCIDLAVRDLVNHCESDSFLEFAGFNFRLTEMQALIVLEKLKSLKRPSMPSELNFNYNDFYKYSTCNKFVRYGRDGARYQYPLSQHAFFRKCEYIGKKRQTYSFWHNLEVLPPC